MQSIITASLCDSRSCNHHGGGEHLKSDMEDLLTLLPPPSSDSTRKNHPDYKHKHSQHKVMLTTCFGLCNHSPNVQLKSSAGPPSLTARRVKLVNDGGFRMRSVDVDNDEEDDKDSQQQLQQEASTMSTISNRDHASAAAVIEQVTTDTAIISNATISKVAHAIGLLKHNNQSHINHGAVRALECQRQGKKHQQNERYHDALECYLDGLQALRTSLCSSNKRGGSNTNHYDENEEKKIEDVGCKHDDNKNQDHDGGKNDGFHLESSLAINKILSKMSLSCAKMRIQWAAKLMMGDDDNGDDGDEHENEEIASKMLQHAAGDAYCVLLKCFKEGEEEKSVAVEKEEDGFSSIKNGTNVQCIISEMMHYCSTAAGLQTETFTSNNDNDGRVLFVQGSHCSRDTRHIHRVEEDCNKVKDMEDKRSCLSHPYLVISPSQYSFVWCWQMHGKV